MHKTRACQLIKRWKSFYPQALPIGYFLREVYANRWLRIHSLPGSKRYAQSEQEYQEILKRYHSVLDDMFIEQARCFVILSKCNKSVQEATDVVLENFAFRSAEEWASSQLPHEFTAEHLEDMGFYFAELSWERGVLDGLFLAVADDRIDYIVIFDWLSGQVFSPYDGGADIFLRNNEERDLFKTKFREYLSPRLDGL